MGTQHIHDITALQLPIWYYGCVCGTRWSGGSDRAVSGDVRGQNDSRNGVSNPFPEVWKGSVSKNSADVTVPRLCGFHRRVEDFRPHVVVVNAILHGYTFMHICRTEFTGAVLVAPAHIPGSYRSVLTLYHVIRGMCSLPVYSGRSGSLSPVQPWLKHIRWPCIALGGLSTDIACMGIRLLFTVPLSGCDVTGHRGFSNTDRRLKASLSLSILHCPSLSPLPLPFPRAGSGMSLLRHGVVSRPDWPFSSRCPLHLPYTGRRHYEPATLSPSV